MPRAKQGVAKIKPIEAQGAQSTQPVSMPPRAIYSEMSTLEDSIGYLGNAVFVLAERLGPVLGEMHHKPAGESPDCGASALCGRLRSSSDEVHRIADLVESLTAAIEI